MKFFAAVVVLALAVSTHASLLPVAYNAGLAYGGLSYNGWNGWNNGLAYSSPLPYSAPIAPLSYTARSAPIVHAAPLAYAAHSAQIVHAEPLVYAAHHEISPVHYVREAHHVVAPIPIVPVVAEGQYVAANRGAVHTAPLEGHTQSVSSINLEAAPGTW